VCGFGVELYLWLWTQVPWTWWVMIGTVVTFGVGWVASVRQTDKILSSVKNTS